MRTDYGGPNALGSVMDLCLGRIRFAVLPVNLQNRIRILGCFECRRSVFPGIAIELAFGDMI